MKFLVRTYKNAIICFWFNPVVMLILFAFYHFGQINEFTLVPSWVLVFIDWRYSAETIFLTLFVGFLFCFLSFVMIKIYSNIRRHEKNKLAITFDFFAYFWSNMFMFLSGFFIAWTFGSIFIDFIEPVPLQELSIFLCAFLAVITRYFTIKAKHSLLLNQ